MLPDYVILIIFGAALYYYVHTSTDGSLISQIFDDCRQQCVSTHSNLSGLSGLQGTSQSPSSAHSEPAQACLCSSCPCAFIKTFINPVVDMYSLIIGTMLQLYYNLTQSMEEIQVHVANVLNCATSCQRQPQDTSPLRRSEAAEWSSGQSGAARWKKAADSCHVPDTSRGADSINLAESGSLSEAERREAKWNNFLMCVCPKRSGMAMVGPSTYGSKENFRIHERSAKPVKVHGADDKQKIPETPLKLSLLPKKSAELLTKLTKPKEKSDVKSNEPIPDSVGLSSESDSRSRVSCPKCVEKSKVCLGECPKAKK